MASLFKVHSFKTYDSLKNTGFSPAETGGVGQEALKQFHAGPYPRFSDLIPPQ